MKTNGIIDTDRTYKTPENARKALEKFAKKNHVHMDDRFIWNDGIMDADEDGGTCSAYQWHVNWLIAAKDGRFAPVVLWNNEAGKNVQPMLFVHQGITAIG